MSAARAWDPATTPEPRELRWRIAVMGVLLLVLVLGFVARLALRSPAEQLPSIANTRWIQQGRTIGGGQPTDIDLLNARDLFDVAGVVNLRSSGAVEGWTVRDFDMAYLWIPVEPGSAPSLHQMELLTAFVDRYARGGDTVFIHDDTGLDRVPATAIMLRLSEGAGLDEAIREETGTDPGDTPLTPTQRGLVLQYAATTGATPAEGTTAS